MLFRLLLLPAGAVFVFAQSPALIPLPVQTAMQQLTKDRFRAHMAFLADDLLEEPAPAPADTSWRPGISPRSSKLWV